MVRARKEETEGAAVNVGCPRCGCNLVHWIRRPQPGWFSGGGRAQCDHCRLIFNVSSVAADAVQVDHHEPIIPGVRQPDPPQAVRYQVLLCPKCGAPKPRVTSTQTTPSGKVRHFKCRAESCGHTFKLTEQVVRPPL